MRNYEALSKSKTGVAAIRLVRHVKRDTVFQWFCIELQRICFGERMGGGGWEHGKDLVQLTPLHTMSMKGKSTDGGIH